MLAIRVPCEIAFFEVEASPEQLGPNVIGNDPWFWTDKRAETTRRSERSPRVEAAGNPFPLLNVTEECADRGEVMRFSSGRERLAGSALVFIVNLCPLPNGHPANEPDPLRCEFASPRIWRRAVRVCLGDPTPCLKKQKIGPIATVFLDGAGPIPALDPFDPHRIYAVSCVSDSSMYVPPVQR